jgi:hypothetical protein
MTDLLGEQAYHREQHIKLHLLTSLARSQRALTHMLESVADISSNSKETALRLADNITVIAKYQHQLTAKITGISMHRKVRNQGSHGEAWLNQAYITDIRKRHLRQQ